MTKLHSIDQTRKDEESNKRTPLGNFYQKTRCAKLLLNHAEEKTGKNSLKIKSEARKQYVIALITALETYFNQLIYDLVDKHEFYSEGFLKSFSLGEKYTLFEVYKIKKEYSLGQIINNYSNFQNLKDITDTFSDLFKDLLELDRGKKEKDDLWDGLYKFQFQYEGGKSSVYTIKTRKDIKRYLKKILKQRHLFTHKVVSRNTPSIKDLERYYEQISDFIFCIDVIADQVRGGVKASKIIKR